jgi:16S rRNA (guanine527-N7)-methyltransferase
MVNIIKKYFPDLNKEQETRFADLHCLYTDWNSKINLISRKDIDCLYEKHILHSLGIAKVLRFTNDSKVLDVGTGGGFPGIPLAILFPEVRFVLLDSISKKIKVVEDVALQTGLKNVECIWKNVNDEKRQFDFVVSRAVMSLSDLFKAAKKNIVKEQRNALPNGFICLKGGDLQAELAPFKNKAIEYELSDYFEEAFFETKKAIYLPL